MCQQGSNKAIAPFALDVQSPTRTFWMLLVLSLAIGAALRFYKLADHEFDFDEIHSIQTLHDLANTPSSKVFGYLPMYVYLRALDRISVENTGVVSDTSTWHLGGFTKYDLRMMPTMIGILSIPILGLTARQVIGCRPAGILMLLLAVSTWHIYYSQMARFYSQQFLFYNLAMLLYFQSTQSGSRIRLFVCAAMLLLAFMTQPPALVIVPVIAVDWLLSRLSSCTPLRGFHVKLGGTSVLVIGAVLLVCLAVLQSDVQSSPGKWTQFVAEGGHTPKTVITTIPKKVGLPVVCVALCAVAPIFRKHSRLTTLLLIASVLPMALFSIAAEHIRVGSRYMFVTLFPWLALCAIGLDAMYAAILARSRILAVVPLGLVLGSMVMVDKHYFESGGFRIRFREALDYVEERRGPQDSVWMRHPVAGRYYLTDPDVRDYPRTAEAFASVDGPSWILYHSNEDPAVDRPWIADIADLEMYFITRDVTAIERVEVYRYPSRGDRAGHRMHHRARNAQGVPAFDP